MEKIDARGLTCPGPVLETKKVVEAGCTALEVIVDNPASAENVTRFLGTKGFVVASNMQGGDYFLTGTLDGESLAVQSQSATHSFSALDAQQKIVVLITSETLGQGDDALGKKLMVNYLKTIAEMGSDLWQLIFVNGGVKYAVTGSPVMAELLSYEKAGVQVFACGTCLEHFGLTVQKEVGASTNMLDIVTATQLADKVITLG